MYSVQWTEVGHCGIPGVSAQQHVLKELAPDLVLAPTHPCPTVENLVLVKTWKPKNATRIFHAQLTVVGLYGETGALATKDVRKRGEEVAPGLLRLTMA